MKIDGNQIKIGNIINHKGHLWKVIKTQHTQPGKGGAYLQVELKNIKNKSKLNERFRSSETVEKVRLDEKEFQFLYKDDDNFHFMDTNTFEQIILDKVIITAEQEKFLSENLIIKVDSYEEEPISIQLPETINLKVIETDSVIKGQTATSSYKPAIMENNLKVLVPPHIVSGDIIVINPNEGTYIEKAKE
tara:strand:- start:1 stop:570 length:570 start_codon:yes stop_codon:yes gene_type:complete